AQVDEHVDRVEARVLGERAGDDLQRVREGFDGELAAAADAGRVLAQLEGELDLGSAAARDDLAVLDRDRDDADRVFERALDLVHDVLGAAAQEHAHGARVLALGDEGHLVVADLALLHEARVAKVLLAEVVEVAHDRGAGRLLELLHVALLDAAHGVDASLREEVLREVVDALLDEDDVRAGLDDLVDLRAQDALFLVEEALEGAGARDLDLRVDLGLLDLEGDVEEGDLRALDALGHAVVDALLVHDDALDHLRVVHA